MHTITQSHRLKIAFLLFVLLASLSITGVAAAQSSPNFDFACWGLFSNGGGQRASTNFRILDSFGQWSTTISNSPNARVRPGFIQQWYIPMGDPGPNPFPPGENRLFMPTISRFVRTVRTCVF